MRRAAVRPPFAVHHFLELTPKGKATNARNAERFAMELTTLRGNLDRDPEEILDALRALESALRKTISGE